MKAALRSAAPARAWLSLAPALLAATAALAAPAIVPGTAGSASATSETLSAENWVRVGVIIASRKGLPDDKPLRFAYKDGEKLERLLVTVGQIEPENLFFARAESRQPLQLEVAKAGARIAALKKAGRKVFLQFYYTGHGAARNFHLSDGPLGFGEVKEALGGLQADARVYILDVCYGASFFTAKGFRTAPPLQLQMEMDKGARGEVTISSSAGDEQAYEVRTLGGSIFTSHWIMALRGAGDRNRDGQVTLFEAYNYAYDRTSGYSAETLARPQHPSFQIDLTGARDMMLARLLRSSTGILFRNCPPGNYNLLDLGRGHQIGELRVPDGEEFTLALEQGRYRVQYLPAKGKTLSADVDLPASGMSPLTFAAFTPVVADAGQMKGPDMADAGGMMEADEPGMGLDPVSDGPAALRKPAHGPSALSPVSTREPQPFPGDSRWRLTSSFGWGPFKDEALERNIQQQPEVDGYFGTGGRFEPPVGRRTWSFDLGFSPWGPWMAGARLGISNTVYSRSATGQEPLNSVPKSVAEAYPVKLDWKYDFRDIGIGGYLGRSFRVTSLQTLSADVAWSLVNRQGESNRTLERTLYRSLKETSHEISGTGYRLETGLGWTLFTPSTDSDSRANLGIGLRLTPYYQKLDDIDPAPDAPILNSRETGVSLSFILTLGHSSRATWSER